MHKLFLVLSWIIICQCECQVNDSVQRPNKWYRIFWPFQREVDAQEHIHVQLLPVHSKKHIILSLSLLVSNCFISISTLSARPPSPTGELRSDVHSALRVGCVKCLDVGHWTHRLSCSFSQLAGADASSIGMLLIYSISEGANPNTVPIMSHLELKVWISSKSVATSLSVSFISSSMIPATSDTEKKVLQSQLLHYLQDNKLNNLPTTLLMQGVPFHVTTRHWHKLHDCTCPSTL